MKSYEIDRLIRLYQATVDKNLKMEIQNLLYEYGYDVEEILNPTPKIPMLGHIKFLYEDKDNYAVVKIENRLKVVEMDEVFTSSQITAVIAQRISINEANSICINNLGK